MAVGLAFSGHFGILSWLRSSNKTRVDGAPVAQPG